MGISIKATSLELTPALKDYAEKRLSNLGKFTGGEPMVAIELGKSSGHHNKGDIFRAEVNVLTPLGKQHRAVSEKADMYEAIDDIRAEIVRELTSAKDKKGSLFRRGARKIKNMLKGFRN